MLMKRGKNQNEETKLKHVLTLHLTKPNVANVYFIWEILIIETQQIVKRKKSQQI